MSRTQEDSEVARKRQVHERLTRLEEAIEELRNQDEEFWERLDSVLSSGEDLTKNEETMKFCPLANKIHNCAIGVEAVVDKRKEILRRLEI